MDIPRRVPKTKLPAECYKLSIEDCEHPKNENKCRIKSTIFGGKDKCIANENYLIEKELSSKGFQDFARLDENNLEEELQKRDQLCRQLSSSTCKSPQAKVLGCKYTTGIFKKGRCALSEKIINYYYKTSKKCLCKNCDEDKEPGFKLCHEHRLELKEIIETLNFMYQNIMKGVDVEKNYNDFIILYKDLMERYHVYLIENMATAKQVTEKYNEIRLKLGEGNCQCVNIKSCIGKGNIASFCKNKAIKSSIGMLCKEHKQCFLDRKNKFQSFRENFKNICGVKSCKKEIEELRDFYNMILYCTVGEADIFKNTLLDYLYIMEQYIKELS